MIDQKDFNIGTVLANALRQEKKETRPSSGTWFLLLFYRKTNWTTWPASVVCRTG